MSALMLETVLVEEKIGGGGPRLRVDEDAGVVYGVRVCGSKSANSHGQPGATRGTRYTAGCLKRATRLYEEARVFCDHLELGKSRRPSSRKVEDLAGMIRKARFVDDHDGPAVRGDLHLLSSHPITPRVIESVRKGMPTYGLSHHALPARADVKGGEFVIEDLEEVLSVDLVHRPATSRCLAEGFTPRSSTMTPTTRRLIEAVDRLPGVPPRARHLARRLLEQDDAPMATDADASTDPASVWVQAYETSLMAILKDLIGRTISPKEAKAKFAELVDAFAKDKRTETDTADMGDAALATVPTAEGFRRLLRGDVLITEAGRREFTRFITS